MKSSHEALSAESSRKLKLAALIVPLLLVFGATAVAQRVEVSFASVAVKPGDHAYFQVLLDTDTPIAALRVPLFLPSIDVTIDSVSFRYSVAPDLVLYSAFNNNNRREFISVLPSVGGLNRLILQPGGEICRVYFEVERSAPAGSIPIDSFIRTRFIGGLRIDEQLDASDQYGNSIVPQFQPGEIRVEREEDADTTSEQPGTPDNGSLPSSFTLRQNYPNPFNPTTRITFSIPYASEVSLIVYDGVGREIEIVAQGNYPAGRHSLVWDATRYPSGVYFYRLMTPEGTLSRKMVVIK